MGIVSDIFHHRNLGSKSGHSGLKIGLAKVAFDLVYICILVGVYYFVFYGIDLCLLKYGFYEKEMALFNTLPKKAFLFVIVFNIINFVIYFIMKLFRHKHLSLWWTMVHRTVFVLGKMIIQYLLLLFVLSLVGDEWLLKIKLFGLSTVASIAFLYFCAVRIILNTITSKPLWYARAKENSISTGYKDVGFYTANWCGDIYYVGTANDGTGKRMYNYYTGKGCSDGDKFAGLRLGLRFRIYKSNNPDLWEKVLYIVLGAPYRNRENPVRSQNVKKTSNYKMK